MKFGFLAHPVSTGQRNLVRTAALVADVLADRPGWPHRRSGASGDHISLPVLRNITSAAGARCSGEVRYLPYVAEDLLRHQRAAMEVVTREVTALAADGASIVGLGGATSIIGHRGQQVAARTGTAVTSGNSLTAYAAYAVLGRVAELLGRPAGEQPVTVVGYPGSIALALTRLLLADGHRVDAVHRPGTRSRDVLLRYLPPDTHRRVTLLSEPGQAYERGRLFVAASTTGGLIDPAMLRPGSLVLDVALPRDVPEPSGGGGRDDILVLDGGLISPIDEGFRVDDGPIAPTRLLNACLAETIVLALEGRAESFSLGRELSPHRVLQIGDLARRHGLAPVPLASYGRTVSDDDVARLGPRHGIRSTVPASAAADAARGATTGGALARATAARFRRHLNPPMAELLSEHSLDNVFTSARGCTLVTADGVPYLDFVAGYGCLNLGHNPPAVVDRVRAFLDAQAPTFVQYVSMPVHASELAERLCDLAPAGLDRVFFSNSGAEAVEAALKLARAATGRHRLVYVENSYHGKTLGALSVTGQQAHRTPFGPLVGECVCVPYGDLRALAAALDGAAAFVVEPVLGEGGVILPPDGYLPAAQQLCRAAGAVFVVDEIQTGLGRTGALFASEHWNLEPDVLCLAKSLSGGLVPIGATLSSSAVWDAAYGSTGRSTLHTSTFGGGNLAAAAGLATLDALAAQDLPAHAAKLGAVLRRGLNEVADRYSFIGEIRGIGMMNAIAFDTDLSGALGAALDDVLTRLPGDLHQVVDLLDDETRAAAVQAAAAVESALGDLLCLRFVRELAARHRILTFVTANRHRVLRIQPPLVLAEHEADRFVEAVADVAANLSHYADLAAR
ncbi:aminotransferase class III-fold pyridoxal phosphate-dependent enzyme [Micromonospora sp. CPCC 206061]|uniref:aminotransferase class III-fold pyridoxal phosphate-dependent enzyme n=1 Tax=Micromonospora sp. CPCC 206061 TaxID=3122410 RepID=UPI002FF2A876